MENDITCPVCGKTYNGSRAQWVEAHEAGKFHQQAVKAAHRAELEALGRTIGHHDCEFAGMLWDGPVPTVREFPLTCECGDKLELEEINVEAA